MIIIRCWIVRDPLKKLDDVLLARSAPKNRCIIASDNKING